MTGSKSAVLLLAHGSPETPTDVPEFMALVTSGRPLSAEVIEEVKERYARIGRSPLLEITMRQAELLQSAIGLPVFVGMRNWKPLIAETVKKMAAAGVVDAIAICLAPQNSRTSVGLYRKAVLSALAETDRIRSRPVPALARVAQASPPVLGTNIEIHFVESWHDHPELIRAFSEKLATAWQAACKETGERVPVIFTAHSVPTRTVEEGDPYEKQARETADLIAKRLPELAGVERRFAFQSPGMASGPWLGPTVEETILNLKRAGHSSVLVQPIGFLCDHVEVLYDIDIVFRNFAQQNGMRLWRTESLNDSPALTAALAEVARSRVAQP